jgi:hypothetical protein
MNSIHSPNRLMFLCWPLVSLRGRFQYRRLVGINRCLRLLDLFRFPVIGALPCSNNLLIIAVIINVRYGSTWWNGLIDLSQRDEICDEICCAVFTRAQSKQYEFNRPVDITPFLAVKNIAGPMCPIGCGQRPWLSQTGSGLSASCCLSNRFGR